MVSVANQVAEVAQQIADESATNRKLPASLLQLKRLVDSVSPLSDQLSCIIHDVWQLKLVDVLAVVLKMDFTATPPESWTTAAQLVNLAIVCFVSEQGKLEFGRDQRSGELILQLVSESVLQCARNCQTRYSGLHGETMAPASSTEKVYCLRALKAIFNEMALLLETYPALATSVIRSANLSQILMSELDDVATIAVSFIATLYSPPSSVPPSFDATDLVEEMLFKLATTGSIPCCRESIAALTNMIAFNGRYANLINVKFKGVKEMIAENWTNRLLLREEDLKDFFRLVDAQDPAKQIKRAMNPQLAAVLVIQAHVRSYLVRKRLKTANATFSKLQNKWRERKRREFEDKMAKERDENARFQLFLSKKHRIKRSRQVLLKQMLATPAEQFPAYLRNLEESSAARIQAAWRGHQVRKKYGAIGEEERRNKAAAQIQSSYRRYRARVKKLADSSFARGKGAYDIAELTPERRAEWEREIQRRVIDFRSRHPNVHWTHDRLGVLHERGQDALARYYRDILDNRHNIHDCSTAMARIEIDLATMRETCPRLQASTAEDAARLACVSKPIRTRAKAEHKQTLDLLSGPWWGRFNIETEREEEEYRRLIASNGNSMPPNLLLAPEKDVTAATD